jgi:exopolysaccharide production protein ExoY
MATPEFLNTDITYQEERVHSGGFADAHAPQVRDIPGNLPIASFNYRAIKPLVDLIIVFMALPILLPLCAAVILAIMITSPGEVLYRHRRIGQFQQPLYVWKFRTMYKDSDQLLEQHLSTNPDARREWSDTHKLRNDPRVTPIGKFLRKTSLDELPQFLNVLRGDMSLVGPRPPLPYELAAYQTWHRRRVLQVKPGITGLWQVTGRSRVRFDDMVRLDLRYAISWSPWLDFKILLRTPGAVIKGAY